MRQSLWSSLICANYIMRRVIFILNHVFQLGILEILFKNKDIRSCGLWLMFVRSFTKIIWSKWFYNYMKLFWMKLLQKKWTQRGGHRKKDCRRTVYIVFIFILKLGAKCFDRLLEFLWILNYYRFLDLFNFFSLVMNMYYKINNYN